MKKRNILILALSIAILFVTIGRRERSLPGEKEYGEQLGTVQLYMEYETPAEESIRRGLALLHHMTYNGARGEFKKAVEEDPESAMGYWGEAMTYIHPLWADPPSEEEFNLGISLLEKGKEYARGREMDYIEATEAYYRVGRVSDEKENLRAFARGWERVYEKYPEDSEAAAFYALAHLSTADPDDKTYVIQREAGRVGEAVLEIVPDHPGGHHYIIHAYDYPELAPMALEVSRSYGSIAPAVPHALHMPTHIFTRLGLWDESIEMNMRSGEAALAHPSKGQISLHYPHAVDYLVYAYIQNGEDGRARGSLEELMTKEEEFQTHIASHYTFNAAPARLLLERQRWDEAMKLEPWLPVNYERGRYPAMEAITYFARALGAARTGNEAEAEEALEELKALEEKTREASAYWAKQIEVQDLSAKAWLTYNTDREEGIRIMREAADLEATTEKHPVTPGEVLPARELLGDMLMESERYEEALKEYERALMRSRNRFNSLYGAGRAAELMGDIPQATKYYERLSVQGEKADTELEKLIYAREFVGENE